jgi:hypothetical protein
MQDTLKQVRALLKLAKASGYSLQHLKVGDVELTLMPQMPDALAELAQAAPPAPVPQNFDDVPVPNWMDPRIFTEDARTQAMKNHDADVATLGFDMQHVERIV